MATKEKGVAMIDPKELSANKAQLTKASNYATDLQVTSKEDYEMALDQGKKIKTALDTVVSRREEITRPMNDALKSTRALFKPIETGFEEALATIKGKMTRWFTEEKRRVDEETAKIAARVEKGTLKEETALRKIGEVEKVERVVETETAKASMRTVRKVRFASLKLMPPEDINFLVQHDYIIWDSVKARKDALSNLVVPGSEIYEDQELAIGGQSFKDTNLN